MKINVYNKDKFGVDKKEMTITEYKKYFADQEHERLKEEITKSLKKNWKNLNCDGHGIYYAKHYLVDLELPEEIVIPLIRKHKSRYSEGHKGIIYANNGSIIDYMYGVNNSSMLNTLCNILGANDYELKNGRGSQAAQYFGALHKKLNIKSD